MHSADFKNLKLCLQDVVIRVVLFHGPLFFVVFLQRGNTITKAVTDIYLGGSCETVYGKKKKKKSRSFTPRSRFID